MKISQALKTSATINTTIPSTQLDTRSLVERIKTMAKAPNVGYGLFVKERALKPEIGMKEFAALWDQVVADPHKEKKSVTFKATHMDKNSGIKIMVVEHTPSVVTYILEYGPNSHSTGSSPAGLFEKTYQRV